MKYYITETLFLEKYLPFFFFSLYISFVIAEPKISDYKKYPKTNSEYKLQKLDVSFEHPWGITSINNEEMIITEKGGGLFKFNKKPTQKLKLIIISNTLNINLEESRVVCWTFISIQMMNIYILPLAMIMMVNFLVQRLPRESFRLMKLKIFKIF